MKWASQTSLNIVAEERVSTRVQVRSGCSFYSTVVGKRLADRENNFRILGLSNTQAIHSKVVTEYLGGNEIAISQVEGAIGVATGL